MNTAFRAWRSRFLCPKVHWWQRQGNNLEFSKFSERFFAYASSDKYLESLVCRKKIFRPFQSPHLPVPHSNKQAFRLLSISRNRCWKCNGVVTERDLVCMSCGTVQEPRTKLNYFELFKETPNFELDVRTLSVKFRRLQNLLHPDKFATRPEKEKLYSAEQSSLINKAYQTLLRPIDRGLYLLELHSKPLDEDEIQLSSDFLANVMEVNEMLEGCRSAKALETIRHMNDAKLQILYSAVSLSFKEKNIDKARESLIKLKYHLNIDEKIRQLEDDMGISRED